MRFIYTILFLLFPVLAAAVPMAGVVLDNADLPVPYAEVVYVSGKYIGQADARGRFDFNVDSRSAVLLFKKQGFDSLRVELQDFIDLLDVVVVMHSSAKHLGSAIVSGGNTAVWQVANSVSVQKLEDVAGMRFDLTEHLSQMSGISGQKDFSGELFYDGSRSKEIAYHFGEFRIPNMRHLDIGFPGNLSVINPHAVKSVNITDDYGKSPFSQGMAGAIQFEAKDIDSAFAATVSLGTTLREIYLEGPWLFWSGFAFGARMLDPSMLKNMGEKFYTEFRKRSDSNDDVASSNSFSLSSFDLYARLFDEDSLRNKLSLTALYSNDTYSIRQDTAAAKSTPIIKGSQTYSLANMEYKSSLGTTVFAGLINSNKSDTLRDTTAFKAPCASDDTDCNYIDGYEKNLLTVRAGVSWEQTENAGFALLYDLNMANRKWVDWGAPQGVELSDHVLQVNGYYNIKGELLQTSFGAGGIFSLQQKQILPLASVNMEKKFASLKDDFVISGNAAWRADWSEVLNGRSLDGELKGNASVKGAFRYTKRGFGLSANLFGRFYPEPTLPIPAAYEYYNEQEKADYAWVSGGGLTAEWRSLHHVALQSNLSSVYGEYELANKNYMPWEANSRLDMVSHLRIYPRTDSMLSVIVSHRAAWKRPLYEWRIKPSYKEQGAEVEGERSIRYNWQTSSLFRTDLRVNLDLTSKVKVFFLDKVRFFIEGDNIFAPFNISALSFLGGDNVRERSVTVRKLSGDYMDGYDIVPFMVKGMGFYLQFGVEASFGG